MPSLNSNLDWQVLGALPEMVQTAGGSEDFIATPLQSFINAIEQGRTRLKYGPVFALNDIVQAHKTMEENQAGGKIVILT